MVVIRNESLLDLVKARYTAEEVRGIVQFLQQKGTFRFPTFKKGLFPAAGFDARKFARTGYQNVWVRDNFYIAYAHYVTGQKEIALRNILALAAFFKKERRRFLAIIRGKTDPTVPMNRPHIRFNGHTGRELKQKWSHAQNDALGYFLWLHCQILLDGSVPLTKQNIDLIACFVLYFDAIRYWRDEDNGHWEEKRKIEASSIGVVVGALQMAQRVLASLPQGWRPKIDKREVTPVLLRRLIANGTRALDRILPAECVQPEHARRYDAALLFLIYPMNVVSGTMAERIIRDVAGRLQGDYGIRRYLGDSYWAADYKKRIPAGKRTIAYAEDTGVRDAFFQGAAEAQWCIFDPILSIIHGRRFQSSRDPRELKKQITYLNRSLGQLTGPSDRVGAFRCPEAYCVQSGRYSPNDHTPLLWTQANLRVALQVMEESLTIQTAAR